MRKTIFLSLAFILSHFLNAQQTATNTVSGTVTSTVNKDTIHPTITDTVHPISTVPINLSVSGILRDQISKNTLPGASVQVYSATDSTFWRNTVSDSLGRFAINDLPRGKYFLDITYGAGGFKEINRPITLDTASVNLDIAAVQSSSSDLATVVITANIAPIVQKGDTLQFTASQYKVNPDASAEDLVKKMPGIQVQNGQVTANGENVQKVTIDGRELFGDDATAALRNLPAEVIDKIQVFDRLSDQAAFTGFDDGNTTKSINIITKVNMRNGQYGRVFAGYGTDDRYNAGGNTTILHGDQKISIVGLFNNINQQNFSTQDLLGVSNNGGQRGAGGGGFRGGGGGGGGGQRSGGGGVGSFGANSNFIVGTQSGINKTNAFGINYADNWGPKLQVTGSYFFNNTNNITNQISNIQYFDPTSPNNADTTTSNSQNYNNRVNVRLEYKIDSFNQLIITPTLAFQSNTTNRFDNSGTFSSNGTLLNTINSSTNAKTSGNNLNNSLLYRHAFHKKGRTISLNLNTSSNTRNGNNYQNEFTQSYSPLKDSVVNEYIPQTNSGYQVSANLAYTEPIAKNTQLQLNYNPSYSHSNADQETYFDDGTGKYTRFVDSLSSKFTSIYKTQNGGVAYRYGTRDNQLSLGVNYQYSDLSSNTTYPPDYPLFHKTFSNFLPNAMLRLKLSTKSNIRILFRTSASQPSVTQMQDVVDKVSNAPYVVLGNPNLAQQTTNLLSARYTFTNAPKGTLFVANIFLQNANNYITSATFIPRADSLIAHGQTLLKGQQLTEPINMDGYLNLRSYLTFAIPLKLIKSQLNFNGGIIYTKLPGMINNIQNISKTLTYNAGAVIGSNVSQYVDFTISYSGNFNNTQNDVNTTANTTYYSHTASVNLNLLSKSGWFYQTDVTNQLYSGLSASFNQDYFLWNMSAGKKFLKDQKGELKLSVFDILKQNQSVTRNVTGAYIQDVLNQVLQQYFMLTFTYNLKNFGKGIARPQNNNRNNGGFPGGGRPNF